MVNDGGTRLEAGFYIVKKDISTNKWIRPIIKLYHKINEIIIENALDVHNRHAADNIRPRVFS